MTHRWIIAMAMAAMACSAQAVEPNPILTTRGKLLHQESFETDQLPETWTVNKGTWHIKQGALQGAEKASDEHAAVAGFPLVLPKTVQIQFDFKLDGAQSLHLSFNGKGHICRVVITPTGFTLKGDKNKKDPKDKPANVGHIEQAFEAGKWHTMLVELDGPQTVAFVDPAKVAFGADPKIDRDKNVVRFPLSGQSASIDNLKIWAAESNPTWPQTKAKLPANTPPQGPTLAQRFGRSDKNNDGKISQAEFISPRPKDKQAAALKAFQRKDANGDGFLDLKEFAPVAKKKPPKAKDV